jgi:hypothetical protein
MDNYITHCGGKFSIGLVVLKRVKEREKEGRRRYGWTLTQPIAVEYFAFAEPVDLV